MAVQEVILSVEIRQGSCGLTDVACRQGSPFRQIRMTRLPQLHSYSLLEPLLSLIALHCSFSKDVRAHSATQCLVAPLSTLQASITARALVTWPMSLKRERPTASPASACCHLELSSAALLELSWAWWRAQLEASDERSCADIALALDAWFDATFQLPVVRRVDCELVTKPRSSL